MAKDSNDRIPECPVANLARMRSIADRWRKKLGKKKEVLERTESRLAGVQELIAEDEALREAGEMTEDREREAKTREVLARKYEFELHGEGTDDCPGLIKEVGRLMSQVKWADRQQIPFLRSEVRRLEAQQQRAAAMESMEEAAVVPVYNEDGGENADLDAGSDEPGEAVLHA